MNMSSILTSKYHIVVYITTIIWFLSCIHRISSFSPILLSSSSLSTSSSSSSSNTLLPVLASIKNGNDNNDDENQQTSSSSTTNTNPTTNDSSILPTVQPQSLYLHHIAIRTRNIETAIKFYSLLGYNVEHKFRSGPARAAWLTNVFFTPPPPPLSSSSSTTKTTTKTTKGQCNNIASRIELIEVPSYILNEKENTIKKAIDLIQNESLLGLNHYAIDVTPYIEYLKLNNYLSSTSSSSTTSSSTTTPTTSYYGLDQFLQFIESQSIKQYNKTIRIAVKPRQQVIGDQVFELAFIYDADGTIVELVRYIKDVTLKDGRTMDSGWEPWDGKGFVGLKEK